ncbi:hypothetical protein [Yersinia intermedia]|uniref:hypothetical protein n=1 Tax=Yersinia intermedia TaxID=631 RepID=UPI001CFC4E83|nr:hypothetical protein [Yersinia intermedia]MCB5312093.1 hypothetical protein [Yersinia intermedia]MCB5326161.1 hypothetical protein [Yersinia intermedia]
MKVPVQKSVNPTILAEYAEEAYKEYRAQFGTRQSLERLYERGGFSYAEMVMLLYQRVKRLEESGK